MAGCNANGSKDCFILGKIVIVSAQTEYRVQKSQNLSKRPNLLFCGNGLCEVSREVDVETVHDGQMVRQ